MMTYLLTAPLSTNSFKLNIFVNERDLNVFITNQLYFYHLLITVF